jgi:hypothetical protein
MAVLTALAQLSRHDNLLGWIDRAVPGSAIISKIFKMLMTVALAVHLVCCVFFGFTDGSGDENWMSKAYPDEDWRGWSFGRQYLSAFYWGVITITTVGYGEITPASDSERAFAMTVALLGSMLSAVLIGELTSVTSQKNAAKAALLEKTSAVKEYLRHYHFPRELRATILEFYEYGRAMMALRQTNSMVTHHPRRTHWERSVYFNEDDILAELPFNIRHDVAL